MELSVLKTTFPFNETWIEPVGLLIERKKKSQKEEQKRKNKRRKKMKKERKWILNHEIERRNSINISWSEKYQTWSQMKFWNWENNRNWKTISKGDEGEVEITSFPKKISAWFVESSVRG